jgi:hypothetical protein
MKADNFGGPAEQARFRVRWRKSERGASHRCDTCRHLFWAWESRAGDPRCRQLENVFSGARFAEPMPDAQRYFATQVSRVCDRWEPKPEPETTEQRMSRLARLAIHPNATRQEREDAAAELAALRAQQSSAA